MRLRLRPLPAILAASTIIQAGCSAPDPREIRAERARESKADIVIGVAWPWSAPLDIRYGDGLQLAVDEVNAGGGINGRHIALRKVDDQGAVDAGRMAAYKLGQDPDVVAVIGHLQSYVTVPAAAVYDAAGLLMLAPVTTDPELTKHGYTRVFRGTFTDRTVGTQMAEYAAARGYHRVAVYYVRDVYGRTLANAFEARANTLGLQVPARESYDPNGEVTGRAFTSTLRDWKRLELDAIFVAGEMPSAGVLVAEARKAGLTMPILGGDAMSSGDLMRIAGPAAEGTVVASMFSSGEPREAVQKFTAAFHKRFNAEPDAGAALGYDAVQVLTSAMRRAKSVEPDSVAVALRAPTTFAGVTGAFRFDSTGELVDREVVKLVVKGGKFEHMGAPILGLVAPRK